MMELSPVGCVPENLVLIDTPSAWTRQRFAGGWILLKGRLWRRGGDYDARLYWDLGAGWKPGAFHHVPATAAGAINEFLLLPAGVRRLAFHPGTAVQCTIGELRVRAVTGFERCAGMLARVITPFLTKPAPRRLQAGLTFKRAVTDLAGAYEAAGTLRAHAAAPAYPVWCARHDTLTSSDRTRIAADIVSWADPPFFHVLIVGPDSDALERTRASLDAQFYRRFRCTHAFGDADKNALSVFNEGLFGSTNAWALILRSGDVLAAHALYWFACIARESDVRMVYADEDHLDARGERCRPLFKPDWSLAHARSTPFHGEAVVFRAAVLAAAGGFMPHDCSRGCHDAVLRILDAPPAKTKEAIAHIPAVLLHRGSSGAGTEAGYDDWAMEAVRQHLARRQVRATVESTHHGVWRVRYALERRPFVSVIVPTRDRLELTRRCIDSLRERTRYAEYEILLVDNQSRDPEALTWMRGQAASGVFRLLAYDQPFNYAAINNMAVDAARGELVCLLNNDTEIVDGDWLAEMVAQALQPGVDVVGAKLLYPDGVVQHAGDIVGVGGVANHAHAWIGRDDPGYCGRAVATQEYSAVTAACLLTWRDRYRALGGLDARGLPVAFNDVDYCLRARRAGGLVVWTPHAVLLHHESASRGQKTRGSQPGRRREAALMRRRWSDILRQDPFYNPNLNHMRADFSLDNAPVVPKPWFR